MCNIYLSGDARLFKQKTRSIRIDGHVTSIRIEMIFWQLLDKIAYEENMRLSTFLSQLYTEGLSKSGDVTNFSSVIRVACTTYLTNQGEIGKEAEALVAPQLYIASIN